MDHALAGESVIQHWSIPILVALAVMLAGCGESGTSGAGEPFRVLRGDTKKPAEFWVGPIPASAAEDAGVVEPEQSPPTVTAFSTPNQVVFPGQRNSKISGRLSKDSSAIALAFDKGTGYWLLPAGVPDSSSDDELSWQALCDYSPDITPGYHELKVAAIDTDGTFGAALTKKLCIAGRTPDHLNACESALEPPKAVISLSWDSNVDLDLQVVTPKGRLVTPKKPSTLPPNADGTLPAGAGVIDRDSNAACAIDGIRYENLVFEKEMPQDGTWGIYANLFDSCKQAIVHFTVTVHIAKPNGADDSGKPFYRMDQVGSRQGILLATQASGDANALGTYLFEVDF